MAVGDHHRAAAPRRDRLAAARAGALARPTPTACGWPRRSRRCSTATSTGPRRCSSEFGEPDGETAQMGARLTWQTAQAELALARGDHAGAIRRYDDIVAMVVEPTRRPGINPWLMLAASAALVARARHGARDTGPAGRRAARPACSGSTDATPTGRCGSPTCRSTASCWSRWRRGCLRFGPPEQHEDGVRLLAIAHRWAYNRSIPVMAWEPMVALADAALPGTDRPARRGAGRPPRAGRCCRAPRRSWTGCGAPWLTSS